MKDIYISCCSENGGIQHYTFENGVLTLADTEYIKKPMYTVLGGDIMHVIIKELDAEGGGALTYRLDGDGRLCDRSQIISTLGLVPCHHHLKNGKEYVVNYVSGSIVRLPDVIKTHSGRGVHPTRQEKAHTHFVTSAPDGRILCTDLGIDKIVIYDDDLNEISHIRLHDGAGPRHLVFSKDGNTLYCANELEPSVSVIDYKQKKVVNTYPLPQGTAAAIRLNGDDLYVSVRGSDVIVRFKTVADTLIQQEITEVRGCFPRDFDIFDGYVICTNERSDNVTVFELIDGRPEYRYTVNTLPEPLCVIAK